MAVESITLDAVADQRAPFDERTEYLLADSGGQAEQSLRLARGEAKTGHFDELGADPFQQGIAGRGVEWIHACGE
jgi:hypothetical protein